MPSRLATATSAEAAEQPPPPQQQRQQQQQQQKKSVNCTHCDITDCVHKTFDNTTNCIGYKQIH